MNLARYAERFTRGINPELFAEQHPDGSYTPVRRPIAHADLARHLNLQATYGVYPVNPQSNTTQLLIVDVDDNNPESARRLQDAALMRLLPCWLEHSGRKGWHLWIFLSEPVPAQVALDAGKVLLFLAGLPPTTEVFPKQGALPPGGVGNLIKLPLGLHQVSRKQSRGDNTWHSVPEVTPDNLRATAALLPLTLPEPTPRPTTAGAPGSGHAYALGALRKACELVEQAEPGGRNITLNREAFTTYRFVVREELDESSWEEQLANAGLACGLSWPEIRATLNSAKRGRLRYGR